MEIDMRVLMLTSDLQLGGAERIIINRVHCLHRRGVECAVAGLFEGEPGQGRARRLLERDGVEVFCAGVERVRDAWRLAALRRFVARWRPDVLHCHLFHGHLAGLLLRLWGMRAPMVWSYHSIAARPLREAFYRVFWRAADAHVFISRAVQARQSEAMGGGGRQQVIYNGIELEPLLAIEPKPGPVFGAVGRLRPQVKGFDVLVRAFARLAREDAEVRLRIAGEGPGRESLEALALAEGVAERVELVGFADDVPDFLAGINVFVNPSRWEALGNTLAEGMAAGLPCIASRTGGLPEVGGHLVRWVRPGDMEDLYEAMRQIRLTRRPAESAARQRQRVRELFSREGMAEAYRRLYASLV
jgi:glycosyltransferase involved in cell wall biosynthesis